MNTAIAMYFSYERGMWAVLHEDDSLRLFDSESEALAYIRS